MVDINSKAYLPFTIYIFGTYTFNRGFLYNFKSEGFTQVNCLFVPFVTVNSIGELQFHCI